MGFGSSPRIYKSTDYGSTWNLQQTGSYGWYIIDMSLDGQYLYAVNNYDGTFHKSTDHGDTWSEVGSNNGGSAIAMHGVNYQKILRNGMGTYDSKRLYYSADSGANWTEMVNFSAGTGITDIEIARNA
jgi:photosystem II stability/assembly factor-like uncharacterized protein